MSEHPYPHFTTVKSYTDGLMTWHRGWCLVCRWTGQSRRVYSKAVADADWHERGIMKLQD